jgi:hypothetical protein
LAAHRQPGLEEIDVGFRAEDREPSHRSIAVLGADVDPSR